MYHTRQLLQIFISLTSVCHTLGLKLQHHCLPKQKHYPCVERAPSRKNDERQIHWNLAPNRGYQAHHPTLFGWGKEAAPAAARARRPNRARAARPPAPPAAAPPPSAAAQTRARAGCRGLASPAEKQLSPNLQTLPQSEHKTPLCFRTQTARQMAGTSLCHQRGAFWAATAFIHCTALTAPQEVHGHVADDAFRETNRAHRACVAA